MHASFSERWEWGVLSGISRVEPFLTFESALKSGRIEQ